MPTDKQIEAAAKAMVKEMEVNRSAFPDFRDLARAALTAAEQAQEAQPVAIGRHVAYFDDGQFYWMSGISPRNCELYTSPTIPEGWQPIETAPSFPCTLPNTGPIIDRDKIVWFDDGRPTHWMPLPAAPKPLQVHKEPRE